MATYHCTSLSKAHHTDDGNNNCTTSEESDNKPMTVLETDNVSPYENDNTSNKKYGHNSITDNPLQDITSVTNNNTIQIMTFSHTSDADVSSLESNVDEIPMTRYLLDETQVKQYFDKENGVPNAALHHLSRSTSIDDLVPSKDPAVRGKNINIPVACLKKPPTAKRNKRLTKVKPINVSTSSGSDYASPVEATNHQQTKRRVNLPIRTRSRTSSNNSIEQTFARGIEQIKSHVDNRFDAVESHIAQVDHRIEHHMGQVHNRSDELECQVKDISAHVQNSTNQMVKTQERFLDETRKALQVALERNSRQDYTNKNIPCDYKCHVIFKDVAKIAKSTWKCFICNIMRDFPETFVDNEIQYLVKLNKDEPNKSLTDFLWRWKSYYASQQELENIEGLLKATAQISGNNGKKQNTHVNANTFSHQDAIGDKNLIKLAGLFPSEWVQVGVLLGLKLAKLENIGQENNRNGNNEPVSSMLLEWRKLENASNPEDEHLITGKLIRAFLAAGRKDLAAQVCSFDKLLK